MNEQIEDIQVDKHAVCIPKEVLHSDSKTLHELIHCLRKGQQLDIKTLSNMYRELAAKAKLEENSCEVCCQNLQTDDQICGWSFEEGKTDEIMKNIIMKIREVSCEKQEKIESKAPKKIKKDRFPKVTKTSTIKTKNLREERKYVSDKMVGEIPHKKIDIHIC